MAPEGEEVGTDRARPDATRLQVGRVGPEATEIRLPSRGEHRRRLQVEQGDVDPPHRAQVLHQQPGRLGVEPAPAELRLHPALEGVGQRELGRDLEGRSRRLQLGDRSQAGFGGAQEGAPALGVPAEHDDREWDEGEGDEAQGELPAQPCDLRAGGVEWPLRFVGSCRCAHGWQV